MPEGTATLEITIVAQDFCEALAEAALLELEEVKVTCFSRLGAAMMAGSATGVATAQADGASDSRMVEILMQCDVQDDSRICS